MPEPAQFLLVPGVRLNLGVSWKLMRSTTRSRKFAMEKDTNSWICSHVMLNLTFRM